MKVRKVREKLRIRAKIFVISCHEICCYLKVKIHGSTQNHTWIKLHNFWIVTYVCIRSRCWVSCSSMFVYAMRSSVVCIFILHSIRWRGVEWMNTYYDQSFLLKSRLKIRALHKPHHSQVDHNLIKSGQKTSGTLFSSLAVLTPLLG